MSLNQGAAVATDFYLIADCLAPFSTLPEMSFAAYLEMLAETETRKHIEHQAARYGLNPAATNRILNDNLHRARLLNQARLLLLAMVPREREIRNLLETH